jgi:hypothetical protein
MKPLLFICSFLTITLTACGGANISPASPTSTISSSAVYTALPQPTTEPLSTATPIVINATDQAATQGTSNSLQAQFDEINKSLSESMKSSIAYNIPVSMNLDDSATIELLLNPQQSPEELGKQVTEGGQVVTATIEITPFMKAELISVDMDAFTIQPMLDNPIQPIGTNTVTKWAWVVNANKAGPQKLTLVISRLVKAQGQDYWTIIQTYKSEIDVKVTVAQWLASLDWKWIIGIIITALVIPGFWRWNDQRKKQTEAAGKTKKKK